MSELSPTMNRYPRGWRSPRRTVTLRPNSGHELYGIALSYELAGDKTEAARAYREFLTAWKSADSDLPMVKHAQSQSH